MIKIPMLKDINYGRKFVRGMATSGVLAPIILLEASVTGGRTIQAFKRGGYTEGRERLTEESIGAAFWLGGVHCLSKIGDYIGSKIFKQKNLNFDTCRDALRNPFSNFAKSVTGKVSEPALVAFKAVKVGLSVLIANALVGFVVPKLNQAITRKNQAKDKIKDKAVNVKTDYTATSLKEFLNKSKDKKETTFGSMQAILTLTNNIENHAVYKLLSTDVGITSGRAISARNKYEREEILFRDISSLYFYMFSTHHINKLLNLIEDGNASRLDPVASKQLTVHLQNLLEAEGGKLSPEEFMSKVFGNLEAKLPEGLNFKTTGKGKKAIQTILLKDFEAVEKDPKILEIARRMSELQPKYTDSRLIDEVVTVGGKTKTVKKLIYESESILSKQQLEMVYRGGAANDPKFVKYLYEAFGKKGDAINPNKFVPHSDLSNLNDLVGDYAKLVAKKAKAAGTEITEKFLKKMDKQNLVKNSTNLGIGMVISALFLSTFIPKIQYWMTKRRTGSDEFPGVSEEMNKKS